MNRRGADDGSAGNLRGGWRYFPGTQDSTGFHHPMGRWLSMIYDQSLGANDTGLRQSELNYWLGLIRLPRSGCYQGPGSGLCEALGHRQPSDRDLTSSAKARPTLSSGRAQLLERPLD